MFPTATTHAGRVRGRRDIVLRQISVAAAAAHRPSKKAVSARSRYQPVPTNDDAAREEATDVVAVSEGKLYQGRGGDLVPGGRPGTRKRCGKKWLRKLECHPPGRKEGTRREMQGRSQGPSGPVDCTWNAESLNACRSPTPIWSRTVAVLWSVISAGTAAQNERIHLHEKN